MSACSLGKIVEEGKENANGSIQFGKICFINGLMVQNSPTFYFYFFFLFCFVLTLHYFLFFCYN